MLFILFFSIICRLPTSTFLSLVRLLCRYYSLCGQYAKALRLFIQCGDREIDAAIDVVGRSQNESLTHQLIDFLVGEKDGVPKDPNYIYRLYLALKKYEDAAKTALIIARQEQDLGNYQLAHSVVVETIRQLEDSGIKVPLQLRQTFVLLHSYILVKSLAKRNDHEGAARLLLRIVQNVSKFPLHVVQILTSTVIECQRAGLKASSYENAAVLMRPEYRPLIDPNLKRKIEAIVRRRYAQGDEAAEATSSCPVSNQPIPQSQLECPTTRDALPMCVVTGRHMTLDDWCFCPVSKFPALYSEYKRYIEEELRSQGGDALSGSSGNGDYKPERSRPSSPQSKAAGVAKALSVPDPVLGKSVSISDLKLASAEEATKYIQRYNNVIEKKEKVAGEAAAKGEANADGEGAEATAATATAAADKAAEGGAAGKSSKGGQKASKSKIERARRNRNRKA